MSDHPARIGLLVARNKCAARPRLRLSRVALRDAHTDGGWQARGDTGEIRRSHGDDAAVRLFGSYRNCFAVTILDSGVLEWRGMNAASQN